MLTPHRNLKTLTMFGLATLFASYAGNLQAGGSGRSHKQKSVVVEDHPFSVTVSYSEKASKLIIEKSETVIVAAYFSGGPKKGAPLHYSSDMGEVGLGQSQVEIVPGKVAAFRQITLDADALAQIDDQGLLLLINVFSGRKSSKNNLLSCDIYEGPIKAIEGKNIDISCRLISEGTETKNVANALEAVGES